MCIFLRKGRSLFFFLLLLLLGLFGVLSSRGKIGRLSVCHPLHMAGNATARQFTARVLKHGMDDLARRRSDLSPPLLKWSFHDHGGTNHHDPHLGFTRLLWFFRSSLLLFLLLLSLLSWRGSLRLLRLLLALLLLLNNTKE